jgi:hypothetical protein
VRRQERLHGIIPRPERATAALILRSEASRRTEASPETAGASFETPLARLLRMRAKGRAGLLSVWREKAMVRVSLPLVGRVAATAAGWVSALRWFQSSAHTPTSNSSPQGGGEQVGTFSANLSG